MNILQTTEVKLKCTVCRATREMYSEEVATPFAHDEIKEFYRLHDKCSKAVFKNSESENSGKNDADNSDKPM